jgi:hypothetical protein
MAGLLAAVRIRKGLRLDMCIMTGLAILHAAAQLIDWIGATGLTCPAASRATALWYALLRLLLLLSRLPPWHGSETAERAWTTRCCRGCRYRTNESIAADPMG